MLYDDFKANWQTFSSMVKDLPDMEDEQITMLVKRYIEQNILILNEVFESSIDNLNRLQQAKTANDVICTQVRFTNEINHKFSLAAQRFLNESLANIADYNEWLRAHCDLATD